MVSSRMKRFHKDLYEHIDNFKVSLENNGIPCRSHTKAQQLLHKKMKEKNFLDEIIKDYRKK